MDDGETTEEPVAKTEDDGQHTATGGEGAGTEEAGTEEAENADGEPSEVEDTSPQKTEPSLAEQLQHAKEEIKTAREKMLRVAADFDNFRKRSAKEVEAARRRGLQGAVRELLPVFDNLERATEHVTDESEAKGIADGVRMVHKLFLDTLSKMGIERVEAVGQAFDPNLHDGMQHLHSDEYDAGTVMQELQPGYKMGGELLRPALVIVSKGPAPQEEAATEGDSEDAEEGAPKEPETAEEPDAGDDAPEADGPESDEGNGS